MNLIEVFSDTMRMCIVDEKLSKAVCSSVRAQRLIFEGDEVKRVEPAYGESMKVYVSHKRSFEAARSYALAGKKVCVLNFASFVTPGGGVLKGSQAQEESLCRVSTLYPALTSENVKAFYTSHREKAAVGQLSRKNNDDCIYTPGVVVIKKDTFDAEPLLESGRYTVDVLTCAAPDLCFCTNGRYMPSGEELFGVMKKRIERIISIASANRAEVLILGAFGCGAFGNPPEIAAKAFEAALENYKNHFETVEFAVYCKTADEPNYQAFSKIKGAVTIG